MPDRVVGAGVVEVRVPHTLLVADAPGDCRARTALWVDEQLAAGAKVYYRDHSVSGRRPGDHWLVGTAGAERAADAVTSGQLEFGDLAAILDRSGGTAAGVRRWVHDEVTRALDDEGWPSVAISQESAASPLVAAGGAVEYAAQEACFDDVATHLPLHTLCRLDAGGAGRAAVREATAVHHRSIRDRQWSATSDGWRWRLHGELDAHAVPRFGAALHGALRERRRTPRTPDLAIDLSGVGFLDFTCAQTLALAARAAGRHQRVVLHGASPFARRILEVAGCPPTLLFADP